MLTDRIKYLRDTSLEAEPSISGERAELITGFYRSGRAYRVSAPVRRALAFKHLLENKSISIYPGELIVGERGPSPKATPTYPEINAHSLEDLDILNGREKVSFSVSGRVRELYRNDIIPFWKGRCIRDVIFRQMSESWKWCYQAGIFTEFMEQRAPGHTVLDDKIYRKGFKDFKRDIGKSIRRLDFLNDPRAYRKREELRAMAVCADALISYAGRYSGLARRMSSQESDPERRSELERISEICRKVPADPPADFWEALQYYWFVHLGVITEYNTWDSFNPGRLDQHLYPFFKSGLDGHTLTRDDARDLLRAFWIKFNNQPAPPKVGVTAEESSTYTDFALINLGGLTGEGEDGVNSISMMILDVIEEMRLLQPSSMVQISRKTPRPFLVRALEIIKTGFGQPSVFNSEAIVKELLRQGKSITDARNGGASGCVETGAFGKENYNLTGYFNLTKVLEIALNNGVDPLSGKRIGINTGRPEKMKSFGQLTEAFRTQLERFINIKVKGNSIIERLYAERLPAPFLSILIDDCIAEGLDYHDGGARYNTSYIMGVGLGTITDTMSSIKYNVFDKKRISMVELMEVLKKDFKGNERIRQMFLNKTPKFGNSNLYADDLAGMIFDIYFRAVEGRKNTRGGEYHINLLPTTVHIYFGRKTGATADGRRAFHPLSEGISPVQGADTRGPTGVIKSASRIDHLRTGGTLLNQKFSPDLLERGDGIEKLADLISTYFLLDGHHIQMNVVTAERLKEAKQHPEKYRNLIVRVAGYSDYFINLSPELQSEIISRTEHKSF